MRDTSQRSEDAPGTYRVESHETPSEAVVRAVSTASGAAPVPGTSSGTETSQILEPLHRAIDPDALDSVFAPRPARTTQPAARVTFRYHGHTVTVTGTDTISVVPHDRRSTEMRD